MKARAALLGVVLFLTAASSASAMEDEGEDIDPTRTGVYIGASMGAGFENFGGFKGVDFKPSASFDIFLGYRASEYLSVEAEFDWLNGFEEKLTEKNQIGIWSTTLNFRVHIPLGRIEPYVTYGGGVMEVEGDSLAGFRNLDFMIKGGGGVQYYATDKIIVFADATYIYPISSVKKYDHVDIGLGVLYKF